MNAPRRTVDGVSSGTFDTPRVPAGSPYRPDRARFHPTTARRARSGHFCVPLSIFRGEVCDGTASHQP